MPFTLDCNDPTQVASASHIEFYTGQPGQKGLIFSGIAIPSWNLNDDKLHRDTVTVNLRYPVLAVIQATISMGLASIYGGDPDFVFGTDGATLCVDDTSQELMLQVDLALMGSPAHLNRFGYQVVVIATTQDTGISGKIMFPMNQFDPSKLTESQIKQLFLVSANKITQLPPPAGAPFGQIQYTPVAYGTIITGMPMLRGLYEVSYVIPSAPYNQNLHVLVQPGPLFTAPGGFHQLGGPDPIVLTVNTPSVGDVDFGLGKNVVK